MLGKIAASSVLIIAVLIIRAVFQKKISPVLLYSMWFIVAVRLILPGTVGISPISIMNTGIWNLGSTVLKEEQDRQYEEYKEQLYPQLYEKAMAKFRAEAMQSDSAPKASDSGQRVRAEEALEAAGDISAGLESSSNLIGNTGKDEDKENVEAEAIELKWHPAPTLFGKIVNLSVAVWLMGMLVFSVIFLWKNLSFYRYLRQVRRKIKEIGTGKRRIPVYVADDRLSSPCLFGLVPAVYIPGGSNWEDPEQEELLTYILEHELTHYRHGDHIWAFVRILCLIINWYNPLVYAAARLSVRDGELACDAGCIYRLGEDRKYAYGEALLAMIKPMKKKEELFKYATMMTSEKNFMKKRIEKITENRRKSIFPAVVFAVLMLFAAGCTYTGNEKEEREITATAETASTETATAETEPAEAADVLWDELDSAKGEEKADEAAALTEENRGLQYGGKVIVLKGGDNSSDLYGNLEDKFLILTPGSGEEQDNEERKAMLIDSTLYMPDSEGNYVRLQDICRSRTEEEILKVLNCSMDLNLGEIEIWDYDSFIDRIDGAGGLLVNVEEKEIEAVNNCLISITGGGELKDEEAVTKSGSQILNGIQTAAYLQLRYQSPGGYYRMMERWEQTAAELLQKEGIQIKDSYTAFFAGVDNSIYVEDGNDYLLCFEWAEEIRRVHEVLYDDSSYQVPESVTELDLKMKEQAKKAIANMRSDAGKIFELYCLYMGDSPFIISLLAGDSVQAGEEVQTEEVNSETAEAWNSVTVAVSGLELVQGEGRAVYVLNLVFEDSGIIGFPEYTEDNHVSLERFLYLVKKEDGWYADGPLHNNLPSTEWWLGEEIEWHSYDFGFSDEEDLGVTTGSQEEYDEFIADVQKRAIDKLRFNPNRNELTE